MKSSSTLDVKMVNGLFAEFELVCRRIGLRLTHQRREIYRLLLNAGDHPSAETLYERLRQEMPTISLDTVYRNLHTMETHDLIARVPTGKSQARFEAKRGTHHHPMCSRCGEITDIQWEIFDNSELPDYASFWGQVTDKQATLTGVCKKCLQKK